MAVEAGPVRRPHDVVGAAQVLDRDRGNGQVLDEVWREARGESSGFLNHPSCTMRTAKDATCTVGRLDVGRIPSSEVSPMSPVQVDLRHFLAEGLVLIVDGVLQVAVWGSSCAARCGLVPWCQAALLPVRADPRSIRTARARPTTHPRPPRAHCAPKNTVSFDILDVARV